LSEQATLFPQFQPPATPEQRGSSAGPFAGVALEQSIDRVLDYSVPPQLLSHLRIGQRVRVPLGRQNRPAFGYVVALRPTAEYPKIKNLLGIADDRVLITPQLLNLSRWISRYYAAPLGVVLDGVIPSAVRKRIGLGYSSVVRRAMDRESIQAILEKTKAPKRRAILARLLLLDDERGIDLQRLASESGTSAPTVRKLAGLGLITIRSEVDLPRLTENIPQGLADEKPLVLNSEQQAAFDALRPRMAQGAFSVNLLHGVTGSGKTEIYLQCIADCVAAGRQALVLVPEIALTPQTVRRFMARFKNVAVLHSGLTATERHRFWQQISQGRADIVVGARSAVFAPLSNIGVIVVDEEHDGSYKQDQAPRVHARDVAIKRAQLENIPIFLGSATPSLEMYHRCRSAGDKQDSAYHYLALNHRVRGLALPTAEIVDMRRDRKVRKGVHLFSLRLESLLKSTLSANRQAIILLNRRGYANYVYCPSCSNVIQCKYCDATMTYHRSAGVQASGGSGQQGVHSGQLHCHYCLAVNTLPAQCEICGKRLTLFGLGTQRVEEELVRKFPGVRYARVDSDTMRNSRDYEATLAQFGRGEIQVMLGTQMIAKGLDYPNVTLVGVISGDTALALPDFRAAERTFQLITQVAGRAGRGDSPGRVVVQTFLPDDPTIQSALRQDYAAFAATELVSRRECRRPPFARMARIIVRHEDADRAHAISQQLAAQLAPAIAQTAGAVRMEGPMPCAVNRIAGHHRNQIVLSSPGPEPIQHVLASLRASGALAKAQSIAVDVDPVVLL
jgi:primosomal protein N' (replication factor Y)